ncbi:porin [Aestuariibacter halophilus]|uniref:Porin n=1 Tax=Fluctibacter halophilus TaxID=226011 RepID=A0ABS8G8D0_9ALTE|nr:DcaP family trimeric outer membrane transporter [Aestuariibacter halophilus]MCC2616356.1 porin [Aestuariibacter halophilus]
MKRITTLSLAVLTGLCTLSGAQANVLDKTNVKFSGYVKADAMFSSYSDGTLGSGNIGRDFYLPSLIPVGGAEEDTQFDAHVRQTRFRFTTNTDLSNGDKVTGVLELDFMATPDGNERVSNSYEPRIRHAFVKYKNWLVGQTWTTFQDVRTLPESLDFIGVTDGTIFARQAMVRYTNGGLELALENPETTISPYTGGGRIVSDDNTVPDFVARYTHSADWGHIAVAGLLRQLNYVNKQGGADIDSSETGYGISITSKIKFGKDDLRLMANFGSGLGRYLALNAVNGAVLNADNELEAIDSSGFSVAYRHVWNDQWRSNFMYSALNVDNDVALTGTGTTKDTHSARVNVLYSPSSELTFGAEYTYAKRELESGLDGDMSRLQFSAKYAF